MPKRGTILIDYIALCYQVKEIKISSWQGDILGFNSAYFDYRALEKKNNLVKPVTPTMQITDMRQK